MVILDDETTFNAATFIWTAGVKGEIIKGLPVEVWNRQNRIKVDDFNRVQSLKNVFAVGDFAYMNTPKVPNGHPMLAQSTIQQGKALSENLLRTIHKKPMIAFEYRDKGIMATIGKKRAIAAIKKHQFSGHFAWFIWSFVHLMGIIGVKKS